MKLFIGFNIRQSWPMFYFCFTFIYIFHQTITPLQIVLIASISTGFFFFSNIKAIVIQYFKTIKGTVFMPYYSSVMTYNVIGFNLFFNQTITFTKVLDSACLNVFLYSLQANISQSMVIMNEQKHYRLVSYKRLRHARRKSSQLKKQYYPYLEHNKPW